MLQGIERALQDSDPMLASRLEGSPAVHRLPHLRLTWLLLAVVPTLAGLLAVMSSHLFSGFLCFMAAVATGCAYLVCGPRHRYDSR